MLFLKERKKASAAPAHCKTKHVEYDIKAQNSLFVTICDYFVHAEWTKSQ